MAAEKNGQQADGEKEQQNEQLNAARSVRCRNAEERALGAVIRLERRDQIAVGRSMPANEVRVPLRRRVVEGPLRLLRPVHGATMMAGSNP